MEQQSRGRYFAVPTQDDDPALLLLYGRKRIYKKFNNDDNNPLQVVLPQGGALLSWLEKHAEHEIGNNPKFSTVVGFRV